MKKFGWYFLFFVVVFAVVCMPAAAEGPRPQLTPAGSVMNLELASIETDEVVVQQVGCCWTTVTVLGNFPELFWNAVPEYPVNVNLQTTIVVYKRQGIDQKKTKDVLVYKFSYDEHGKLVKTLLGTVREGEVKKFTFKQKTMLLLVQKSSCPLKDVLFR